MAPRIITYFEDEVDRIASLIEDEFEVDPDNSIDKRQTLVGAGEKQRHFSRYGPEPEHQ